MKVGVPKEVKNHEYRVAITPIGVHELTAHGHDVYVEKTAGLGSQIEDSEFEAAGAKILGSADEVWDNAEMVLKVKEPIAEEYHRMAGDALAQANESLKKGGEVTIDTARRMGLFVVSRLAEEHGLKVKLRRNANGGGIIASIILPSEVLVSDGPVEHVSIMRAAYARPQALAWNIGTIGSKRSASVSPKAVALLTAYECSTLERWL